MTTSVHELGLYTIREASRLVYAPRQTVESWVQANFVVDTHATSPESPRLLSFADLISLFVVRELRKADVDVEVIRNAEQRLAGLWGVQKPFAYGEFKTGYGAIVTVLEKGDRHVAVGKGIQEILYDLIKNDLTNVSYDAEQRARLWRPRDFIALRPDLQFGQPCIEGTRITTKTISQFVAGGDSIDDLVDEFSVGPEKIEAALKYEEMLAKRRN